MLSIIVCGRNDGYGVNLHKRTAISLNYLATLCREEGDEILYVDCNTPPGDPALTEAIADTLTEAARHRLRTYRVSPELMRQAIGETPLPFSDELSRNVAICRSNPRNDWILSTNCDILIHPIGGSDLHSLLRRIPRRLHHCPRVNIPSESWQQVDRHNVSQIGEICEAMNRMAVRFPHERPEPWLRFSAVGDFQLAPREHWFQIRGCEEAMRLWGHSDANNALRLSLLAGGGRTPDLGDCLRVYHLDHRAPGQSLTGGFPSNEWAEWIENVKDYRSRNPEGWGLADVSIPEIRLSGGRGFDVDMALEPVRRRRTLGKHLIERARNRLWRCVSLGINRLKRE